MAANSLSSTSRLVLLNHVYRNPTHFVSHRSRPQSLLSRVPASEFKLIRVAVKRPLYNNTSPSTAPIERSIDDPKQIIPLVHIRKGKVIELKLIKT